VILRRSAAFRVTIWLSLVSLLFNVFAPAGAAASTEVLETAGDILQIAIPLSALGTTFFVGNPDGGTWDRQGTKQLVLSYGSSLATTFLLKELVSKQRPTGEAETSYPSGHTASAWSGAAFIGTRYGGVWGWLAYGGALVAAYSRVSADMHYAGDVVAGASIAQILNWVFVTPHYTRLPAPGSTPPPPKWHFTYSAAPAFLISNQFSSPAGTGTAFDLNSFTQDGDPTVTSEASMKLLLGGRNELLALILPFDSRDHGVFDAPVSFGGYVFPAGVRIDTRWELYDLRLRWRNAVVNTAHWGIHLGAGLSYQNTSLEMKTEDEGTQASVTATSWLPYAHAELGWKFLSRWELAARGSGGALGGDWMLNAGSSLQFLLSPRWDFGAGYRYYARSTGTTDLENQARYQMLFLEIGYTW
jgi:membrane-associated phospholipid phosphatase